jgi:hypothetical protein
MTPTHDHTTTGAVQPADSLPATPAAAAATKAAMAPPRAPLNSDRIRFILIGAVIGIAWTASLRGFIQLHHAARRLVLHPGLGPVRDLRPGQLDPDAPARHHPPAVASRPARGRLC